MAKAVILDVLEKTIGKYVVNLDTNSLNVALWSGKIELHSLQLNVHSVNVELEAATPPIPFRVQSGHFGSFQVSVPWTQLMNQPVIIEAKGLYVTVVPFYGKSNENEDNHSNNKNNTNNSELATTLPSQNSQMKKGQPLPSRSASTDDSEYTTASEGDEDVGSGAVLLDQARLHQLQSADEYRLQANALRQLAEQDLEQQQGHKSSGNANTFGAKLVRRIVENLQVEVRNVEIVLDSGHASCGCQLESLRLLTTDSAGHPAFVDRSSIKSSSGGGDSMMMAKFLYKLLEIRGLGIYLDRHRHHNSSSKTSRMNNNTLLRSIAESEDNGDGELDEDTMLEQHDYVLAPLSFQAKLRQADAGVATADLPKYLLQSELSSLSILLSQAQVQMAHQIGLQLRPPPSSSVANLQPLFPAYRPWNTRPTTHPRQWWHYAYRCICRLNGRRTWMDLFWIPFQKRKQYIALYKREIYAPSYRSDRTSTTSNRAGAVKGSTTTQGNKATSTRASEASPGSNKRSKSTASVVATNTSVVGAVKTCHWIRPLSLQEEATLETLEMDPSIAVEGIMMWRNIADAQVKKEQEKHDQQHKATTAPVKSSLFTSLFGSSSSTTPVKGGKNSDGGDNMGEEETPPIVLSPSELAALEQQAMQETRQEVTDMNCQLYNIQFVLKSFRINLLTLNESQLALLQMGAVSTAMQAYPNGSYNMDFGMASLVVEDKHTPSSLFPTVLKNKSSQDQAAFSFNMHKTASGDQFLTVHLSTFEAIAAPPWLVQLKQFAQVGAGSSSGGGNAQQSRMPPNEVIKANPLLAQSLSGSIDLFYDANEGPPPQQQPAAAGSILLNKHVTKAKDAKHVAENTLSNALFDAWKVRTENRSTWSMDLDLQAPILVVPERCSDPQANVLVFDLGHLKLIYGSSSSGSLNQVKQWFKDHPKMHHHPHQQEPILDQGELHISSLSFQIGKAHNWRNYMEKQEEQKQRQDFVDDAIIQPISLNMELAVEASSSEIVPRVCVFVVLPGIVLSMTPDHLARMLLVYKSWSRVVLGTLSADANTSSRAAEMLEQSLAEDDASVSSSGSRHLLDRATKLATRVVPSPEVTESLRGQQKYEQFHIDMQLQRFSVQIGSDDGKQGMEAHLVSVGSALTTLNDGNALIKLNMGWFWILDRFQHEFARTQRLLAHSRLPKPASDFACSDYDILSELDRMGVFDPSHGGSSDLADISVVYSPTDPLGERDPFLEESLHGPQNNIATNVLVDAKLTSLFVNWNPRAVKVILDGLNQFTGFIKESLSPERKSTVILLGPEDAFKTIPTEKIEDELKGDNASSTMVVRAQMEGVELCLRSALDDLPIFTLSMSSANASYATKADNGQILRASLGNLDVTTPRMGQTYDTYHTILGLSPGKSDSLLSVCYIEGQEGLDLVQDDSLRAQHELAAWALVVISPMRMVHIQSQVLALVEYATAGILGALTSQVAEQAAVAAAGMAATSGTKGKLFCVRATGFEVLLPEAAYDKKHFSIKTGELSAEYTALPNGNGGKAKLSLSDLSIADQQGLEMLDNPCHMGIDLVMPPEGVGSHDDQAYRIQIDMSSAGFLLLKKQYEQILLTMDKNIGMLDLYLRDESVIVVSPRELDRAAFEASVIEKERSGSMTHAGIDFVQNPRCMYIKITIHALSLDLLGEDENDGIVTIKATNAHIALTSNPHEEKMEAQVSLRDLICSDERINSIDRSEEERSLISQDNTDKQQQNFFVVSYETEQNKRTNIGLRVGSPRLVLIPDAINDILQFVSTSGMSSRQLKPQLSSVEEEQRETGCSVSDHGDAFEIEADQTPGDRRTLSFSLATGPCSLVLVDLGGSTLVEAQKTAPGTSVSVSPAAETIVLKGALDAKASLESWISTGATINVDAQIHGDACEIYTAFVADTGIADASAQQVLEPFNYSVYGSVRGMDSSSKSADLRLAALSPIEMVFSMRNYALMNAILDGIAVSFEEASRQDEAAAPTHALSAQDAIRIENLDHTLDTHDSKNLSGGHSSFYSDSGVPSASDDLSSHGYAEELDRLDEVKISLKITLPGARLTIVNDLQGLDDALIRFELRNMVGSAHVRQGERLPSSPDASTYMRFDGNVNFSLLADYFDTADGVWKDFFLRPWELNVRGSRGPNRKIPNCSRPITTLDMESFPCHVNFSEEFLMSLASANQMWSVYSMAIASSNANLKEQKVEIPRQSIGALAGSGVGNREKPKSLRRSMAATVARTLVTALPYALENNSGIDLDFKVLGSLLSPDIAAGSKLRPCAHGSVEYFRFPRPKSKGTGGKRIYGQDVTFDKNVSIRVLDSWIEINNVDNEIGGERKQHILLGGSMVLFTQVIKEGKTTVVHVSSGIDIHGRTTIPIFVSLSSFDGSSEELGLCRPASSSTIRSRPRISVAHDGRFTRESNKFGIPAYSLQAYRQEWEKHGRLSFSLSISPDVPVNDSSFELKGIVNFQLDQGSFSGADPRLLVNTEAVCRPLPRDQGVNPSDATGVVDSFAVQVRVIGRIVHSLHPCLDIIFEPRAVIENKFPIPISVRTHMPHTYSNQCSVDDNGSSTHELQPGTKMEVFTHGPSIAVSIRCTDNPVGGTPTGWVEGNWIDLPLTPGYRLPEPLRCSLPFTSYSGDHTFPGGSEFFVVDGLQLLSDLSSWAEQNKYTESRQKVASGLELAYHSSAGGSMRTFFITVCNYSVDHTGEMLFGLVNRTVSVNRTSSVSMSLRKSQAKTSVQLAPLGAYCCARHANGRISLLPSSNEKFQLIHLTMEGDVGMRKSQPFAMEEVSIAEGGVSSTPLLWENGQPSGFFAYQKLVNSYQSELHVIPEFIVYNGSKKYHVRVRQMKGTDVTIAPGDISPLRATIPGQQATISIEWPGNMPFGNGATYPLKVDQLGLRVAIVRTRDGIAVGSVAIQTVVGSVDSRLVVKLAEIRLAGSEGLSPSKSAESLFQSDFLRFRIQWSELKVTLNEGRPIVGSNKAFLETALDRIAAEQGVDPDSRYNAGLGSQKEQTWIEARKNRSSGGGASRDRLGRDAVCSLVLKQFTVDWQKVFKEEHAPGARLRTQKLLQSSERSQLSVIIHNITITDDTPESRIRTVLDSSSNCVNFFDLCVRVRGPLDSELVKVDLFDLNLAHSKESTERIVLSTSEDFAWKILDLGDRIVAAAGEFSGVELELEWDEDHGGYKVHVREAKTTFGEDGHPRYTPPNSEQLYDITLARVSPFTILASFERTPNVSKYKTVKSGPGKALMNYFTQRLKFKIEKAELNFAKYQVQNVRGPPDRIVEMIMTVYMSRMKMKFVTLMAAVSVQDWKFLAARADGDDEFVDGDLVRAAGNLAGKSANFIFKKTGRSIESVFKKTSSTIGSGIESAAGKVGAGAVGAGVNSVITGVGGGIGKAVDGVGTGAGKVVKGMGQGIGQVVGGVTGGAAMMVKGTAKGIATGDGTAIASGMVEGAMSVGTGVGQGVSSVVVGTADGFLSVGKGLFSGMKSVGKGVVGAVRMKKSRNDEERHNSSERSGDPRAGDSSTLRHQQKPSWS